MEEAHPPIPSDQLRASEELAEINRRLLNRENELNRKQQLQEVYNQAVTSLVAPFDLKAAVTEVLRILCEACEAGVGVLFLETPGDSHLHLFTAWGTSEEEIPLPSVAAIAARENRRIVTGDIPADFPLRLTLSATLTVPPRILLAQPVTRGERAMGVLLVGSAATFPLDIPDLVERICVQLALAATHAFTFQRALSLTRDLKYKSEALRRKNTELERANRTRAIFLASVSHELKTPLNAIIGFSRVLARKSHGTLTEKQDEFVGLIQKNGEHLLTLIEDLLTISRAESGSLSLTRQDLNLSQLLEECVVSLQPLITRKCQQVNLDLGPEIPAVSADRGKIKQVLFNLLGNAIKYSPERSVICLRLRLSGFGDEVLVSVEDPGPGIPLTERDRIFEPFYRARDTSREDGTGLGLAVARRLVEMHGGRIWFEPAPCRGSIFTFSLPIYERDGSGRHEIVPIRREPDA